MPSEGSALAAFVLGSGVTAAAVPLMIRLARRTGVLDHPGGYKRHARPTPYLGGLAVLLAVLVGTVVSAGLSEPIPVIACGAVAICLLGTVDDRRSISPAVRLAVQAGVAVAIWAAGDGWTAGLPDWVELLLTVVWVVLAVNAFNLIDNLDGAAASAAASGALGVAAIGLVLDAAAWVPLMALATLGACLTFLAFNLSKPARIFLGDGGSTLLGFLVAATAMGAFAEETAPIPSAAVLLLLGVPLLDTALVMVSRRRRGVPLLTGGHDHLTHRINRRVGSPRKVAAIAAAVQLCLSGIAVAALELGSPAVLAAGALYLVAAMVVIAALELGPASPKAEPRAFPG